MASVRDVFPEFVAELVALVEASSHPEFADQIPALEVVDAVREQPRERRAQQEVVDPVAVDPGPVGDLLLELASEHNAMLLCVTHSPELATRFPKRYQLKQGALIGGDGAIPS